MSKKKMQAKKPDKLNLARLEVVDGILSDISETAGNALVCDNRSDEPCSCPACKVAVAINTASIMLSKYLMENR